jgi:hypothetical protein
MDENDEILRRGVKKRRLVLNCYELGSLLLSGVIFSEFLNIAVSGAIAVTFAYPERIESQRPSNGQC